MHITGRVASFALMPSHAVCPGAVFLENRFTLAMVEYLPGKDTRNTPPTSDGYGDPGEERFVTQKLDISSLQRSPNWMDPHTVRLGFDTFPVFLSS